MAHSYEPGTKAWQVDATEGWIASEVEEKNINGDKVTLVFALANGEVSYFLLQSSSFSHTLIQPIEQSRTVGTTMAALQDDSNSSLPPLMNPTMLEASEDLTNLSHLNEPAGTP